MAGPHRVAGPTKFLRVLNREVSRAAPEQLAVRWTASGSQRLVRTWETPQALALSEKLIGMLELVPAVVGPRSGRAFTERMKRLRSHVRRQQVGPAIRGTTRKIGQDC